MRFSLPSFPKRILWAALAFGLLAACANERAPVNVPLPDLSAPYRNFDLPPHAQALATRPAPSLPADKRTALVGRDAPSARSLIDQPAERVVDALGAPDFQRQEVNAEIWQYGAGSCSLLIYLYPLGNNRLVARHLDARRPGGGATDPELCVRAIASARGANVS